MILNSKRILNKISVQINRKFDHNNESAKMVIRIYLIRLMVLYELSESCKYIMVHQAHTFESFYRTTAKTLLNNT